MERLGPKDPLWFGDSPGGGIYLQPHGLPFAPAWLSINKSGVLMVTGTWNWFGEILHHEGYGPLASLLQLDHLGGATGRRGALWPNSTWTCCGRRSSSAASLSTRRPREYRRTNVMADYPSMQPLMGSMIARPKRMPPRAVACAHPTAAAMAPSHRSELVDRMATCEPPLRLTVSSVPPELADLVRDDIHPPTMTLGATRQLVPLPV